MKLPVLALPAECPKTGHGEVIACQVLSCRYHCGNPGARGPLPRKRRALAGDDCALAIGERGTHSRAYVALALGISYEAARLLEISASVKLKKFRRELIDD